MSRIGRVWNIIVGVLMIAVTALILWLPLIGYYLVFWILTIALMVKGIKDIIYYLRLARHMVGGRAALIRGVLIADAGLFLLSLTVSDVDQHYVMVFLLIYYMFSGVIDILRSMESKKLHSHWRMKFASGLVIILLAITGMVLSITFKNNLLPVLGSFCLMLVYSGVMRIIRSFKRTAITYITP